MIISSARPRSSTRSLSSFRICACVVTSSAVPGSSAIEQTRFGEQRHRDQHALPHPARQHDRIGPGDALGIGHANLAQDFVDARHASAPVARAAEPPVGVFEDRPHLVADGEDRIERSHRVLKHHRHRRAAQGLALARARGEQIAAVEHGSGPMSIFAVAGRMPMIARIVTLLPQPDSPTSATWRRAGTSSETSRSTRERRPYVVKSTESERTESRGSPLIARSRRRRDRAGRRRAG